MSETQKIRFARLLPRGKEIFFLYSRDAGWSVDDLLYTAELLEGRP